MSSDKELARLFKLWASVSKLVLDGKRSAASVANLLQRIIDDGRSASRSIIQIDRSRLFDPATFIGEDWVIAEEDPRALALTEVDLTTVRFETYLRSGERAISENEKRFRMKASSDVPLDAKFFQMLWEEQKLIPESWKLTVNSHTRYIYFDGTVLRDPDDNLCILCLYWEGDGENDGGLGHWVWYCSLLDCDWCDNSVSCVVA